MALSLARPEDLLGSWRSIVENLSYAFQAVVNTHTGVAFGYEALLRGWDSAGFSSIANVFDQASSDGVGIEVNLMLLDRAAAEFAEIAPAESRLLFNIDNRVFRRPDAIMCLARRLEAGPLGARRLCLEISEQDPVPEHAYAPDQLPSLRALGAQIALDDFGVGYSGLQVLYKAGVDLIKIDRFFITDLNTDATRRVFVANLLQMAHAIGIKVVAEGIETESEYFTVREIGCDYVQGYLVDRPTEGRPTLARHLATVDALAQRDRRRLDGDRRTLVNYLRVIDPIAPDTPVLNVLKRLRSDPSLTYIPVVAPTGEPVGILREQDLKEYVYSPYGISLLMNRTYEREVFTYIRRVPVCSLSTRLERVLELYASDPEAEALIVTDRGSYVGLLDSGKLLQLVHEREVSAAREQNPLTKLPGNLVISEVVAETCRPTCEWNILAYYDFNHFKPFNDTYGFRVGDRVIQLFADHLREIAGSKGWFVGHIGGDDFITALTVTAVPGPAAERALADIEHIVSQFAADVESFYDPRDRAAGFITAGGRDGVVRQFTLLTTSVAVLLVPPHTQFVAHADLTHEIARLKKSAKRAAGSTIVATINTRTLPDGCTGD